MTQKQTLNVLCQIDALFQQIDKFWSTLPGDEQNRLNDFHNEDSSLGHCIRWGIQACAELGESEASGDKQHKTDSETDSRSYLERILATNQFIDVYEIFKSDTRHMQMKDESDFAFVKRCAECEFDEFEDGNEAEKVQPSFPKIAADVIKGRMTPNPMTAMFDGEASPCNVAIYDNGGETFDRYTAVYLNQMETDTLYGARGMSEYPCHPQGVGMYCTATPGKHLGKLVRFEDLPIDCRQLILEDLSEDEDDEHPADVIEVPTPSGD